MATVGEEVGKLEPSRLLVGGTMAPTVENNLEVPCKGACDTGLTELKL